MSNSAHDFAKLWSSKLARINRLLKRLPRDVGNEALLFFLNQFKKEETPEGKSWPRRKENGEGVRDSRRGLLVKSGRLRKSIRLTKVTSNSVTIGTNTPYAKYHNEGTERIPQRQFIGKSAALNRRLQRMIKAKILWELRK
jgi:phage gpG-like protein